eukprot:g5300.t1
MVSIKFPHEDFERKLELPQWLPDQSDEEILNVQNVKHLECLFNELDLKISKLTESNAALKEWIKSEKVDYSVVSQRGNNGANEEQLSPAGATPAASVDGSETTAATGGGGTSRSVSAQASERGTPDVVQGQASATSGEEGAGVGEAEGIARRGEIGVAGTASGGQASEDGEGVDAVVKKQENDDDDDDAAVSAAEHYQLIMAVFENNHILDQMEVRRKLLKTRLDKLTMSQGVSL